MSEEIYKVRIEQAFLDPETAMLYIDGFCQENGKKVRFQWSPQLFKFPPGSSISEEMGKLCDIFNTQYKDQIVNMRNEA